VSKSLSVGRFEVQSWAAVAAALVRLRGMTPDQAVAEVLRLKGANRG